MLILVITLLFHLSYAFKNLFFVVRTVRYIGEKCRAIGVEHAV